MLNRLHVAAVVTALAGIAALAALALKASFLVLYGALCLTTIAGFVLVASLQKQRVLLDRTGQTLGQFMRGQWHARLSPENGDDEFSRLQHRINNMLDALDLHLRGAEASIDASQHAEYVEKLRFTALYESLNQQKSLEEIKAERSPTESVGALLQQLGHNVAGLFSAEEKTQEPAPVAHHAHDNRALRMIADRLAGATAQLADRAVHRDRATGQLPLSPASLDQLMARLAEQASVISLNVAIEAARANQGSSLSEVGNELHVIATQLHKARADMASLLASAVPNFDAVPTVPLSFAVDALTTAEAALREQIGKAERSEPVNEAA